MKPTESKQLKQLWLMRFEKMLELEKEALFFYSDLMKKHKLFLEGTKAKAVLESILKDEAHHTQYAAELVRIVQNKRMPHGK